MRQQVVATAGSAGRAAGGYGPAWRPRGACSACSCSASITVAHLGRHLAQRRRAGTAGSRWRSGRCGTGPARSRPPSSAPTMLDQSALQGAVHVLVGRRRAEVAGRPPRPSSRSSPLSIPAELVVGQQPGAVQGPGVRPRAGEVVRGPAASRTGSTCSARTSPRPARRRTGRPTAVPGARRRRLALVCAVISSGRHPAERRACSTCRRSR